MAKVPLFFLISYSLVSIIEIRLKYIFGQKFQKAVNVSTLGRRAKTTSTATPSHSHRYLSEYDYSIS